jgi:biotin transport system substrate-specific component
MAVTIADRWSMARYNAYRWRYELSLVKKIGLALAVAGLTGLAAQIRIPLPFTPVPITGQTFAALLAGVLLGRWWGGISLALYAGLGAAGVPWFNGWTGGISHLAGPTGGYIIGFILAALFLGHFTDKYVRARSFLTMTGLMLFANFVLVYVPGLFQLYLWLNLVKGGTFSFYQVLAMGLFPFIVGDVIKAVAGAAIARGITPKQAYNGEADAGKWANWRLP